LGFNPAIPVLTGLILAILRIFFIGGRSVGAPLLCGVAFLQKKAHPVQKQNAMKVRNSSIFEASNHYKR
jgi:hypothetical protein